MARLVFASITSLDLYVNDERGEFGWAEPDHEVHAFVNELERPVGTYLFGRRLYETMRVWETMDTSGAEPLLDDYARLWRGPDWIAISSTLPYVTTPVTHLPSSSQPSPTTTYLPA